MFRLDGASDFRIDALAARGAPAAIASGVWLGDRDIATAGNRSGLRRARIRTQAVTASVGAASFAALALERIASQLRAIGTQRNAILGGCESAGE